MNKNFKKRVASIGLAMSLTGVLTGGLAVGLAVTVGGPAEPVFATEADSDNAEITVTIPESTVDTATPSNTSPVTGGEDGQSGSSGSNGSSGTSSPDSNDGSSLAKTGIDEFAKVALIGAGIALAAGGAVVLLRRNDSQRAE